MVIAFVSLVQIVCQNQFSLESFLIRVLGGVTPPRHTTSRNFRGAIPPDTPNPPHILPPGIPVDSPRTPQSELQTRFLDDNTYSE